MSYSESNLIRRNIILQTHLLLANFLNADRINTLIHLFDMKQGKYNIPKIIDYIKQERKDNGLNDKNIIIKSDVSGLDKNSPSLTLDITKDDQKFIHLSIHLSLHNLESKYNGMIHIGKDIYKINKKRQFYALISIKQPEDKPNSLVFSIADGYTTPDAMDASKYDTEVQKEMNVIISVLNKMFDEKNRKIYLGKTYINNINNINMIYQKHPETNNILKHIDKHTHVYTRRNRGSMMSNLSSIKYPTLRTDSSSRTYTRKLKVINKKSK